jgi:hypothetical protein
MTSKKWEIYNGESNVYKYYKTPKIEYKINKNMVDKIKTDILNNKVDDKINKKDNLYRFYKMYNNTNVIIAYTNLKLNNMLYNMIKYSLSGKKTYIDEFKPYIGVKVKLLGIYKGKLNKKIINTIKTEIKDNITPEKIIKPIKEKVEDNEDINNFKEYRKIIKKYYKKEKEQKYYVYSIKDTIYGQFEKEINIKKMIKKIGFEFKKNDVNIIGTAEVSSKLEGLIYIDKYIYNNKIQQPYYIYKTNQKNINEYVYSLVQLDKLIDSLEKIKYDKIDEYIYMIEVDDKYYFDKSKGNISLKNNLENIYMIDNYDIPIKKKLLKTSADKIRVKILKIKYLDSDINLDIILNKYNEKYNIKTKKNKINYKYLYAKKK